MEESSALEFKREVTNAFLKTVSAFANYGGGTILFGVDDEGIVVGLKDPHAACLAIENKINDSISPQPSYEITEREGNVVELVVRGGSATPYLYRAKAYRRNGTSTIEMDELERRRLTFAGMNTSFEQLKSSEQGLTFDYLAQLFAERAGVESFGQDALKTLNLYSDAQGCNNAAALLADKNRMPGIDVARFGESEDVILKRAPLAGSCVLAQLDQAMQLWRDYFCYERIEGYLRVSHERIPEDAFREALANALVHRAWDISANIQVSFYDDRAIVVSPGGLPAGMTEEAYLAEQVSVLRNPILASVFFRLGVIEANGSGVARIMRAYQGSAAKPTFRIRENSIAVTLPVLATDLGLGQDAQRVYGALERAGSQRMSELVAATGFGKTKLNGLLKMLAASEAVETEGQGRATRYKLVR